MAFKRRWDSDIEDFVIDRTITGPPPPPNAGITQTETGNIVGDASGFVVPPATPIKVTLPGPRELVLDAKGCMSEHWWRFFEELYRRTGWIEDNVNNASRSIGGTGALDPAPLSLATAAPTVEITHNKSVPSVSMTITGVAPTVA